MLDRLPLSLQHCLLLEWLSPAMVWKAARASGVLRRAVLESPQAFRAAEGEVLSDACVRWFQVHQVELRLWTWIEKTVCPWTSTLCVIHRSNGKIHRDGDEPAELKYVGLSEENFTTFRWYQYGKLHRDGDKPAIIGAGGEQYWYQNGKRHRDGDKPAIIWPNGYREWYQHGKEHRDGDLPAVIGANGTQSWYQHGKRHRDNGPAVIREDGSEAWYRNDRYVVALHVTLPTSAAW